MISLSPSRVRRQPPRSGPARDDSRSSTRPGIAPRPAYRGYHALRVGNDPTGR